MQTKAGQYTGCLHERVAKLASLRYYPPYARGMAYALSEDVVIPLGTALSEGRLEPFPYREDVSVGLYILELARRGEARSISFVPESKAIF